MYSKTYLINICVSYTTGHCIMYNYPYLINILYRFYFYPIQILYLSYSKWLLNIPQYKYLFLLSIYLCVLFSRLYSGTLLTAYSLLSLQCMYTQLTPVPCVNSDYYPQHGDHTAMVHTLLTPLAGRVCATQLLPDWLGSPCSVLGGCQTSLHHPVLAVAHCVAYRMY